MWILCGNTSELGDVGSDPWKSSLFFLTDYAILGIGLSRDKDVYVWKSTSLFEVSGALVTILENPSESDYFTPGRTYIRIRSPRFRIL